MLCPQPIWESQAQLLALYLSTMTKIRTVASLSNHRFTGMLRLPLVLIPRVVRLMQIRWLSFRAIEPQSLTWASRRYFENAIKKACSKADRKHFRHTNDVVKEICTVRVLDGDMVFWCSGPSQSFSVSHDKMTVMTLFQNI